MTTTNYVIDKEGFENSVMTGNGRVTVKIRGYWSSDPITLYVRRGWNASPEWTLEMSHSSGGRDAKEVECDLEAEGYFAEAMTALVQYGNSLRSRFEEFENMYQTYRQKLKERDEKFRLEKQARIDADSAVGQSNAKKMINNLVVGDKLIAMERGSSKDSSYAMEFTTKRKNERQRYYFQGAPISRNYAITKLAELSLSSVRYS